MAQNTPEAEAMTAYVVQAKLGDLADLHGFENLGAAGFESIGANGARDDRWMDDMWVDIATVKVPARSKRKAVYAAALAQAPDARPPEGAKLRLRALDEASAQAASAGWQQPDPVLEIG